MLIFSDTSSILSQTGKDRQSPARTSPRSDASEIMEAGEEYHITDRYGSSVPPSHKPDLPNAISGRIPPVLVPFRGHGFGKIEMNVEAHGNVDMMSDLVLLSSHSTNDFRYA